MYKPLLLDTSIVSAVWDTGNKYNNLVDQKLASYDQEFVYTSAITLGEIEYGLLVAPQADLMRQEIVRQNMTRYLVIPIDQGTVPIYATLRSELFKLYAPRNKQGRLTRKRPEDLLDATNGRDLGIQENDLWIVSVAIQNELYFISQDAKLARILEIAARLYTYTDFDLWDLEAQYQQHP